jgi:AbiV family abortive infection protein
MTQKTNNDWAKVVGSDLRARILTTAQSAYANACSLVLDAKVLFDAQRFPRAGALAILAEEEYAKSFILCICACNGRWDSTIFRSLTEHGPKQAISQGMLMYWEWLQTNLRRVAELNRCSLVGVQPSLLPSENEWNELIEQTRNSNIKKRKRDKLKQRFFYVGVGREGHAIHCPTALSSSAASKCIAEVSKFKSVVEFALTEQIPTFSPVTV